MTASRFRAVTERLESRLLLSVSRNTDTTSSLGYLPASDAITARMIEAPPPSLLISPKAITTAPSGDNRIEGLRSGYKWGATNLTYSFYAGGTHYGSELSPTPLSETAKANVRYILNNIFSPAINITFSEIPDTPTSYGMMRYLRSPSASYAYAYYPTGTGTNTGTRSDVSGDVVLGTSYDVVGTDFNTRNNSFQSGPGSHGFNAIIHEIGHALGLKHPFETESSPGSSVTLATAEDNQDNTVMTYTFKGQSPATLMPYDLLTLQYYYAAKTTTRSSDTTYAFAAVDNFSPGSGSDGAPSAPFDRMRQTLWDGGGTDTIDLSAVPAMATGYRIDIQPGGWITANSAYRTVLYSGSNFATDYGTRIPLSGTIIENVIVTGSGDSIFLNAAANRISGYTPGVATGADVINGSNQADTLDLTKFLESAVVKGQVGNDLVLNLGGSTGTVMVKDYYASPADRITILYKSGGGGGGATLSIAGASAEKLEGNSGSTAFSFTVTRGGSTTGASSAAWAVNGSSQYPANAEDFVGGMLPGGTVSFAAGETTKTIVVAVKGDTTVEATEGFAVALSAPVNATVEAATANGTIVNDDAALPYLSLLSASPSGKVVAPVSSVVLKFNDLLAPASLVAANFILKGDGVDGLFGTADDVVVSLSDANVVQGAGGEVTISLLPALTVTERYMLTLKGTGSSPLRNLDGSALGVTAAGQDVVRYFTVRNPADYAEPNDTLATARFISPTAGRIALDGIIGDGPYASRDVDIYKVELSAGQPLTIDIDAGSLPERSGLDSFVTVFDASGKTLAFNDDDATADSYLRFTSPAAGTYYIGVSGFGNGGYDPRVAGSARTGSAGDYVLALTFGPASAALSVSIGPVTPDPRASAVDSISIRFSRPVQGFDLADLSLTRNGSPVALTGVTLSPANDRSIWTLAGSGLREATNVTGAYRLVVKATGSGISDVAGLPLLADAVDEWQTTLPPTPPSPSSKDAGDVLSKSQVVSATTIVSGTIGDGDFSARDVDLYRVVLAAGQRLTVDIDAQSQTPKSTLDSVVRVFGGDGRSLAANDNDVRPGQASRDSYLEFRAPQAGTYYVGVSGFGNASYDATQAATGRKTGSVGAYAVKLVLGAAPSGLSTAMAFAALAGSSTTPVRKRLVT